MAIIARDSGGSFEMVPAGAHQAVCAAVWDLGIQQSRFGNAHKAMFMFEMSAVNAEGERFQAFKEYTVSLNEKANLRKDLESWRGRPFTSEEIEIGFELEKLIGLNCLLSIIHEKTQAGKDKATISAIMGTPANVAPIVSQGSKEIPKWIADKMAKALQPEAAQVQEKAPF